MVPRSALLAHCAAQKALFGFRRLTNLWLDLFAETIVERASAESSRAPLPSIHPPARLSNAHRDPSIFSSLCPRLAQTTDAAAAAAGPLHTTPHRPALPASRGPPLPLPRLVSTAAVVVGRPRSKQTQPPNVNNVMADLPLADADRLVGFPRPFFFLFVAACACAWPAGPADPSRSRRSRSQSRCRS